MNKEQLFKKHPLPWSAKAENWDDGYDGKEHTSVAILDARGAALELSEMGDMTQSPATDPGAIVDLCAAIVEAINAHHQPTRPRVPTEVISHGQAIAFFRCPWCRCSFSALIKDLVKPKKGVLHVCDCPECGHEDVEGTLDSDGEAKGVKRENPASSRAYIDQTVVDKLSAILPAEFDSMRFKMAMPRGELRRNATQREQAKALVAYSRKVGRLNDLREALGLKRNAP